MAQWALWCHPSCDGDIPELWQGGPLERILTRWTEAWIDFPLRWQLIALVFSCRPMGF